MWRDFAAPDHPIPRMLAAGLALTISTDDPGLMKTTLLDEYRVVAEQFGATLPPIKDIALNGIRASWLAPQKKDALLAAWSTESDELIAADLRRPA